MKTSMHKGELGTGYLVQTREGGVYMLFNQYLTNESGQFVHSLGDYMGDLTSRTNHYLDIVKVWGTCDNAFAFIRKDRELLWEEMTPLAKLIEFGELLFDVNVFTPIEVDTSVTSVEIDIAKFTGEGVEFYSDTQRFNDLIEIMRQVALGMNYRYFLFTSLINEFDELSLTVSLIKYEGVELRKGE